MPVSLESDSEQRSAKPLWRRPWVGPLAVAVLVFLYLAFKPFVGVPESQAPLPPHDGFPLYYPLLVIHMIGGTVTMLTMVLQVWPWLRQHHPKVHRLSGRIYFVSMLISASMGLIVLWWAPQPGKLGALCSLVFWLATTIAGYRAIRRRDVVKHRRYMLYSFAIAANNWGFFVLLGILSLGIQFDIAYYQEGARWIPWIGNLMLVQWWLQRTTRRERAARTGKVIQPRVWRTDTQADEDQRQDRAA